VYKLDGAAELRSPKRSNSIEQMFKNLSQQDKNDIVDKIHKIRVQTME